MRLLFTLEHLFNLYHLDFLICFSALNAKDPTYRCFSFVLEEDLQGSFREMENHILGLKQLLSDPVNSCMFDCSIARKFLQLIIMSI